MIFERHQLTEKGRRLIVKAQAGRTQIMFTNVRSGAGIWTDAEDISQAEKLKDIKQTFRFTSVSIPDGNPSTVVLRVLLTNVGLKQLYYVTELGIYAEDPDEGEVLYAILTSSSRSQYLPAENGLGVSYIEVLINVEVSNAEHVTVSNDGVFTSVKDFEALKAVFHKLSAGIFGGEAGQTLTKRSGADYDYGWTDKNVYTGAYSKFPAEGRTDALYIDTESSEIYVWKALPSGNYGYFKLPLGSEASATLQKQITENQKAIDAVKDRTTKLENKFVKTELTASKDAWDETTEGNTTVYVQHITAAGVTSSTEGKLWPKLIAKAADAAVAEMKAQNVFFASGKGYTQDGEVLLKCYRKKPGADFGLVLEGK